MPVLTSFDQFLCILFLNFIYRISDSAVSEDAGIEPCAVAEFSITVKDARTTIPTYLKHP